MLFEALELSGAALVKMERHVDERGFFARSVCVEEFRAHGLPAGFVQSSVAWNRRRGTVRGLHFQWPPSREGKLVRCLRGAIHDLLLDLRPAEPTYLRHRAVLLDEDNRDAVFVPAGVAHGFQTLADDCEVLYEMTDVHAPALAAGLRWNDPSFGIRWPITSDIVIAARDAAYPDFDRNGFEEELRKRTAQSGGRVSWT
ncbi:MAG: dTDP-4-dehydrorhamnose 3,5-epimerase [Gammaproteobacteria bacterium]|nr:MAG: dTDP-4-dehydrorhamnose 3,5-epimerase [Gammaproteobacteria bacterium]TLZ32015.1 MAG: dTDP-4-dehydrorhamnose 3,5-epimerase [Gammaproteobacteria bacterium]TLZ48819.1 MAG: dTDP-4-dehydrorhamnose 3,5-epimerase [Gammaproteobacteria bacterium]